MFADAELARAIEQAEARMVHDAAQGEAAFAREVGGGVAGFVRQSSPMNKVIGIGFSADPDLGEVEELYRQRGESVRVELCTLAHPDVGRQLTERGYRLHGFENVSALAITRPPRRPEIHIEAATDLDLWKSVMADGFSHADESGRVADSFTREVIERALEDSLALPGCRRYLAYLAGEPAGAASMRVDGRFAMLTGAATRPGLRRQGVQKGLLAYRLGQAHFEGAELAIVTTSPGTLSHANAVRAGFSLLYVRALLVKD